MAVLSARELIEQEMARHRSKPDYYVDLQIGPIKLPSYYVRRGVLQPDSMTGKPFAEWVYARRELYSGKRVTDMMCGSGILGVVALLSGAEYATFSDITGDAYTCTRQNVCNFELGDRAMVIQADLFDHACHWPAEVILCNAPFSSESPIEGDDLSLAFMGGTELIHRFFAELPKYLLPGGSLLMPYRKAAGEANDPGIRGPQYGLKVVECEERLCSEGVQFGGPLTFYHLQWDR